MKAVLKTNKERGFSYRETDMPVPGKRDILIRIKACAICGSDLNFYVWNSAFCDGLVKELPFIPGHECSGQVQAVGDGVTYFKPGDRVAVETHVPCGYCRQCQIGRPHTCQNMKLFGHNINGCFAEYAVVRETAARKIPDLIPWEMGALLEPLGVAIRPVLDSDVAMSSVCVTGCGPIGLFTISLCHALGALDIFAVDLDPKRLALAKEMGATRIIDALEQPDFSDYLFASTEDGIDVAFEASGNTKSLNEALKSLRFGGTMHMMGQPKEPLVIKEPMKMITLKEATIKGTWGRELFSTWEKAERFMLNSKVDLSKIITHRFSMGEYEKAFETALSKEGCKVIMLPDEAQEGEKYNGV